MSSKYVGLAVAAAVLAACWTKRQEQEIVSGGEVTATRVDALSGGSLPVGAELTVRADQELSTEQTKVGDAFTATVWSPVVAQNGDVIVPRGAKVYGKVVGTHHFTDVSHRAVVQLDFEAIEFLGKRYPLDAAVIDVSNVIERNKATGAVVQRPDTIAVGFITGAVITGSDLRTVIEAARLVADAGSIISLGAGDVEHVIPEGTPMILRTTQKVELP